ncbi:MAG: hypothetical protein RLZZ385_1620 [Pseudomonadota bacterium]
MQLILLADTFPPRRTSGAVLLRDLVQELAAMGHDMTVVVPSETLNGRYAVSSEFGARIVRVACPSTKDVSYLRRSLAELTLSRRLLKGMEAAEIPCTGWDGVVWYSPTIFLGSLAGRIKRSSGCPAYLILRDIFPQWAVDMGLMSRGLIYRVFRHFEKLQYEAADVIGVQSHSNLGYFSQPEKKTAAEVQVLENWLGAELVGEIPASLSYLAGKDKCVVVYAGNMGVAQGLGFVFKAIEVLRNRTDVEFLFIGRGSEVSALKQFVGERRLANVRFHDEIEPEQVSAVLKHCDIGLVSLDERHKTHNVPGKFLSYLQAGLPPIAKINAGNDLMVVITKENVGVAVTDGSVADFANALVRLIDDKQDRDDMGENARRLATSRYPVRHAARQIINALMIDQCDSGGPTPAPHTNKTRTGPKTPKT